MKNYILPFIFILIPSIFFSQSISSALHINDAYDIGKKRPIKKIESKTVFYNVNSTEKRKEIIFLNRQFRVTKEERYNEDNELIFKREVDFKADTLEIKSITTRKIPLFGNEITTTHYIYDNNNFLIGTEKYNTKNQLIEVVTIENNDKGNPISLVINNGEFGSEKATYDYKNNSYSSFVYNTKGELVSSSLYNTLNYQKPTNENIFNEYGDMVSSQMFLFEYKYDEYGNWIKQTRYKKVGSKKILNAEFKRKIFYE